jgi:hypothetical protein
MSFQPVSIPIVPGNINRLNKSFGKFIILKEFRRIRNHRKGGVASASINTSNLWNSVPVPEHFCNSGLPIRGTFLLLPRRIVGVPRDVGAEGDLATIIQFIL